MKSSGHLASGSGSGSWQGLAHEAERRLAHEAEHRPASEPGRAHSNEPADGPSEHLADGLPERPASGAAGRGPRPPVTDSAGARHATARLLPGLAAALAVELERRAEDEKRLMRLAQTDPAPRRRRDVVECRRDNADALGAVVRRHGWPTADQVGAPASTSALMILLHAPDFDFQLLCRDLIAHAAADGRCPAAHHAYIADHCAVELGQPQFYGTRVNPVTLRPYAVRQPETLDERRRDVGLCPLDEQMRALRLGG
ncbi:DUF6624 domain-containing protein [Streptomyces sp. NPDC058371]|uniref:DUF6624 domain-containing protein n=1 Tax=Streptomyces sp. NPDC058371 TaxID=3346463 RepID=UPI003658B382